MQLSFRQLDILVWSSEKRSGLKVYKCVIHYYIKEAVKVDGITQGGKTVGREKGVGLSLKENQYLLCTDISQA